MSWNEVKFLGVSLSVIGARKLAGRYSNEQLLLFLRP